MFDDDELSRHLEIYRNPSEFPYHRRGQSHYIVTLKTNDTGDVFYRRMFVSRVIAYYSWFDGTRTRNRLLTNHPLYPYILHYLNRHCAWPNNAYITNVYFSYFRYSKPYNHFWSFFRYLRHLYYKSFRHKDSKDRNDTLP